MNTEPFTGALTNIRQLGPSFRLGSSMLYSALTRRGQLVTIAALTGRGKSLLAQNCAVHAIQHGGYAAWINLDMPLEMVHDRLAAIMTDAQLDPLGGPQLDEQGWQAMADLQQSGRWIAVEYGPASGLQLEGEIDQAIARQTGQTAIVVIDGFDRLRGDDFDEQCNRLADLAAKRKICIIVTSQVVRDACDHEIVGVDDLAFTMGKGNASSVVVALGIRVLNKLLTCSIVKDRAGLFRDQQVFRLQTEPSLRLSVVEPVNAIRMERADHGALEPAHVNCAEPDTEIQDSGDSDDHDTEQHTDQHCGLKLYHGNKGFIGIGRKIFESTMCQERQWVDLGCLVILYEMAAIKKQKPYAPSTKIPVAIGRGQVMTSINQLANRWAIGAKQVRGFLERAERENLIRIQHVDPEGRLEPSKGTLKGTGSRSIATVITLIHYDNNNGANDKFGTAKDTPKGTPLDTTGTYPGHDQGTTGAHYRTTKQA